jgi:cholesterol oxidase
MGLLQTVITDGESAKVRRRQWLATLILRPGMIAKIFDVRKWSERTVIALVMQNVESSISVRGKRGIFGWRLTSKQDSEHPNATYIPAANEVVRRIANKYGGIPGGHIGDLVSAPFTAHFVGGCVISDDPKLGVIDPYHRVWNYPTLHVVDGSSLTANLGVNPSLTITAQAERAFSFWPNKGQSDPRPPQGSPYKRIDWVRPSEPFVPSTAYGALRPN